MKIEKLEILFALVWIMKTKIVFIFIYQKKLRDLRDSCIKDFDNNINYL